MAGDVGEVSTGQRKSAEVSKKQQVGGLGLGRAGLAGGGRWPGALLSRQGEDSRAAGKSRAAFAGHTRWVFVPRQRPTIQHCPDNGQGSTAKPRRIGQGNNVFLAEIGWARHPYEFQHLNHFLLSVVGMLTYVSIYTTLSLSMIKRVVLVQRTRTRP